MDLKDHTIFGAMIHTHCLFKIKTTQTLLKHITKENFIILIFG